MRSSYMTTTKESRDWLRPSSNKPMMKEATPDTSSSSFEESLSDGTVPSLIYGDSNPVKIVQELVEAQTAMANGAALLLAEMAAKVDSQEKELRALKGEGSSGGGGGGGRFFRKSSSSRDLSSHPRAHQDPNQTERCETVIAGLSINQAVYAENMMNIVSDLKMQLEAKEEDYEELSRKAKQLKESLIKCRKNSDLEVRKLREELRGRASSAQETRAPLSSTGADKTHSKTRSYGGSVNTTTTTRNRSKEEIIKQEMEELMSESRAPSKVTTRRLNSAPSNLIDL